MFYRGEMGSLGWQNWKDYLFSVFIKRSTSKIPLTSLFSLPCLESVSASFPLSTSCLLFSLLKAVLACLLSSCTSSTLLVSVGRRRVCESSWGFKPLYKSYVHMLFDKWIRICGFINKTHLIQQAIFLSWLTSCTAALYSVC